VRGNDGEEPMSEAWQYGVRNKWVVMFGDIFEHNALVVEQLPAREAIIALVNELEDYPPESWHVFLRYLRWKLVEHPAE
jgi:hypothetical protein